jgi:membrane protein implicated in regulation of membrane protease activity
MLLRTLALRLSGTIFGFVAILHLLRILTGIAVTLGTWLLPVWFNYVGFVATSLLCVWLWRLSFSREDDSNRYYKEKKRYR